MRLWKLLCTNSCMYLAAFAHFVSGSTAAFCNEFVKWVTLSVVLRLVFAPRRMFEPREIFHERSSLWLQTSVPYGHARAGECCTIPAYLNYASLVSYSQTPSSIFAIKSWTRFILVLLFAVRVFAQANLELEQYFWTGYEQHEPVVQAAVFLVGVVLFTHFSQLKFHLLAWGFSLATLTD